MKKENFLFGCDEVKAFFSGLISGGIFSHAYLIEGPEGSGKKSLAKYIAASLACGGNCNDCNICHRIAEGHCPDIKFISRSEGQKNISVDAVRDMIDDTSLTPLELDFKMYVIDGAERLSAQAQNSLLKIIEEPPKNVYILLLCESSAQILVTVRSRVQRVPMQLLSRAETEEYLKQHCERSLLADDGKLDFAVRLSGGSVGKAVKLLSDGEKEFEMFLSAKSIIDAQSKKNRGVSEYDMLGTVSKAMTGREEAEMLFSMLAAAYRDILSSKITGKVTGGFFTEDEAEKYVLSLPTETLKKSVEAVTKLSADSNFNFNMTLAAAALSVLLWRA